jgi:uncharacterized protein (TIGR02266 family)
MTARERRRCGRYPCRFRVRFSSADHLRNQYVTNIGYEGLFLETFYPLEIGSAVELELLIGGEDHPVKVKGEVAWVRHPSEGGAAGIGIRFTDLPHDFHRRMEETLRETPQGPLA